ncbi:MAG TPA: sodium pump decarboxylase subunit gamma [Desulfobacteraceae bacterium]|nr:OadG family protein [Deltaproteobacteria bacterium]MBW2355811.1 OadG family protein [Deltaproteobacteria bacterium]HDI60607.1 sodium pump decarboxylase subunit gamma [Desulfobacteraceae bacterium]
MIVAGLKLTLLGMAVVFSFLLLLILSVKISQRFLSAGSVRELAEMEAADLRRRRRAAPGADDRTLVAVISAAIAAHRARLRGRK